MRYFLFFIFLFSFTFSGFAQKKVKLKQADTWKSGRMGDVRYDRLIGNVIFIQNQTTIFCDSAYFFKSQNTLEAFGRVRIKEGDSVNVTASKLIYDGNSRKAQLRNRVVFSKLQTATLYTDYLDYDRANNFARYYKGGKLVDSINTLTSDKGYYNVNSNMASFKKEVTMTNPDYTMYADSLQYNSRNKIIYFRSTTRVIDLDSNSFQYETGEYDTKTRKSNLQTGTAQTEEYTLTGTQYQLDDIRKVYKIRGKVNMVFKKEDLIIHGESSDHFKRQGLTKIYDQAYLTKIIKPGDTLFIKADTLVSIEQEETGKRKLLAYHNVKVFKDDMQGLADSAVYIMDDSTLYFYNHPVLWTGKNQMTADTISMVIKNNAIDKIFLITNAFVVSQDTLLNFNQIKGRKMTAEFADNRLNKVFVNGNAETLYYVLDEKDFSLTGLNRMLCSNVIIRFKEGKVNNLTALMKPEARFIPPHEFKPDDKTLGGFKWQENQKPKKSDILKP